MPQQQGVMSAYQLMPHTHEAAAQGGQLDYVQAILNKPIVDAREYGLSIANTAIQNDAIWAVLLALDVNIHIVEGEYLFSAEIVIPDDMIIRGDGFEKTILTYSGADAQAVSIGDDAMIEELRIAQVTDRVTDRSGLLFDNSTYSRARNLKIYGEYLLKSLLDYNLRESIDFERAYLTGRVGGLPFIDDSLFDKKW